MVQRKAPNKLGSLTKPKRTHVKPERHLPSQQQQDTRSKGGGGGDLKKKIKKMRPIKTLDLTTLERSTSGHKYVQFDELSRPRRTSPIRISDGSPNYMKPTSSSDARKERPQVTVHSPTTTDKSPSPGNSKNLNHSKPSNSPDGSGLKPFKIPSRKPSLKRVRPSMKKSTGVVLYPQKTVNRATCSSTLKDSQFPKSLELNLGGTEADGTSVMRVCPYNYCSLNGHRHAPLPPLKCFMSARRKLLKTQNSFKLKGQPSFRVKGSGKDEKEIDTGQMRISRTPLGLAITPLIEEIANDFFVEIYAKPQEQTVELEKCDGRGAQMEDHRENPQGLDELSLIQDREECAKSIAEEVSGDDGLNQRDESYLDVGLEDDLNQESDHSVEEMDAIMNFMEYVECGQKVEAEEEEPHPSLVPEDYAEWCFECYIFDVLSKESEGLVEGETTISISGATDIDCEEEEGSFPDNKTDYSEHPDDVLGPISHPLPEKETISSNEFSFEPDISSNLCEISEDHAEQLLEVCEEIAAESKAKDGSSESNKSSEEDKTINSATANSNQTLTDAADKPKARMRIIRRISTEESDQTKEFNPRPPQFLPIGPDPEAEKVDLRNQMMDERKNAEEWMIDYALQQAVSKLAPARKRKVALLVEAFETVMPYRCAKNPRDMPHQDLLMQVPYKLEADAFRGNALK